MELVDIIGRLSSNAADIRAYLEIADQQINEIKTISETIINNEQLMTNIEHVAGEKDLPRGNTPLSDQTTNFERMLDEYNENLNIIYDMLVPMAKDLPEYFKILKTATSLYDVCEHVRKNNLNADLVVLSTKMDTHLSMATKLLRALRGNNVFTRSINIVSEMEKTIKWHNTILDTYKDYNMNVDRIVDVFTAISTKFHEWFDKQST